MRKLYFAVIVVLMAAAANAGTVDLVISGLNGQPITPVKEITIKPGDWITFDVVYIADSGLYLFSLMSMVSIEPNDPAIGHLSITDPDTGQSVVTWPAGYWNSDLSKVSMLNARINIDATAADLYTVPPGIVLDHFLYQCTGIGDVSILITENDLPCPCGSSETDGDDVYPISYGQGLVVHQVYEPACWKCPCQSSGDTNGNGAINATDYFNFKKAYGTAYATHPHGTGVGQYNCCCDFNHDLRVDAQDYFIFKKNFGKGCLGTCSDISC